MIFKFVAVVAFLNAAKAGVLPTTHVYHAAPAAHIYHHPASAAIVKTAAAPVLAKADDEFDSHPQYKYSYNVEDVVSGDSKSQTEERDGDVVRGEYSLIDADGFKRTVQYTADDHNGFNAVVHREPLVKTAVPVTHYSAPAAFVKNVAPVSHYAAPAIIKHSAPTVHYAAPVAFKTVVPGAHYAVPVAVKTLAPTYTTYSVAGHH